MTKDDLQAKVASLAKRRGFFAPSFEIYGGIAGFFDYGPMGTMMRDNILATVKRAYLVEEGMLTIDTPCVTPQEILTASGHVAEFTDFVVVCAKCGGSFRADHLLEGLVHNPDALDREELSKELASHGVMCPDCKGGLGEPDAFNLMFQTRIGPSASSRVGFLRPETAQGIFVNFAYLLNLNRGKLPMGVLQIGKGYRNEISPRQGMLRVREFDMAEVEVFFNPKEKRWPGFDRVGGDALTLLPDGGESVSMTLRDAVANGVIHNEALAYFMWVTNSILVGAGIDPARLRFRQHEKTEMAHYAADCWDAEALLSFGWTELVGIADRSAYDLEQHQKATGVDLSVLEPYDTPLEVEALKVVPDKKRLGKLFGKSTGAVLDALTKASPESANGGHVKAIVDGNEVVIPADAYEVRLEKVTVRGNHFIPHVIEPSHGVGRIFYASLEHSFVEKDGYVTLSLPAAIAPVTVGVFPLMDRDGMAEKASEVLARIRSAGLSCIMDNSGSIGRRYARMDEIGTPCCVTVDYDSLQDDTVTLRDRDTKLQVRLPIGRLRDAIESLLGGSPISTLGDAVVQK